LGLYEAAYRWARQPIAQVFTPLLGPAVAALSPTRDDPAAFRRAARAILNPVFAVTVPVLVYLAVEADAVILLLMGGQWAEAIPLFRALCLGVVAMAVLKTTKWFYISLGKTKKQFWWAMASSPFLAAAILAAAPWGAFGVAVAFAAAHWAMVLPDLAICLRGSPLSLRGYLLLLARPFFAAAVAAAAASLLGHTIDQPHFVELPATALVFGIVYATVWLALPGGRRAAGEAIDLVRSMREKPPLPTAVQEQGHD
ncbi:MAG: oligosaccharide flippase family protein, partial [Phycisphaerae bacterium]